MSGPTVGSTPGGVARGSSALWKALREALRGAPDPPPKPPVELEEPPPATRQAWATYSEEMRSTLKWLVAALAAVGTAVFGAGPILSRPELSWRQDAAQLLAAGGFAVLGLLGVGALVWVVTGFLRPVAVDLLAPPATLASKIATEEGRRQYFPVALPTEVDSLPRFLEHLRVKRLTLSDVRSAIRRLEWEISTHPTGETPGPSTGPARATSEHTTDPPRTTSELRGELKAYLAGYPGVVRDLRILEECQRSLLAEAKYWTLMDQWRGARAQLIGAGLAAVLGGVGLQLALSAPAGDDDAGGGSAGSVDLPAVGVLHQLTGEAGASLWDALDLAACETTPGQVPVLVRAGTGAADDPYTVETLPAEGCTPTRFTVIGDAAVVQLTEPTELTITYTPTP